MASSRNRSILHGLGNILFHPTSNGFTTKDCEIVFLSPEPFSFLGVLESLYNIISKMLSLLPPEGTNSAMHSAYSDII